MKKYKYLVIGIFLGMILTLLIETLIHYSVIYKTTSDLKLENNIIIPKNTKLILVSDMPEGFYRLKLGINLDYEDLEKIDLVEKKWGDWYIPYWVKSNKADKDTLNH